MSQRRTFDIPVPQTRRAWVNSVLVAGTQVALVLLALFGVVPWWGALAGVLLVEVGFRAWRRAKSQRVFDEAPTAPSKAPTDETF